MRCSECHGSLRRAAINALRPALSFAVIWVASTTAGTCAEITADSQRRLAVLDRLASPGPPGEQPATLPGLEGAGGSGAAAGSLSISATPFADDFASRLQSGPDRWRLLVHQSAVANNIPGDFLMRLIAQESGFRPASVSRAGALGIAQFMPGTAALVGLSDPFDPEQAIPRAAQHLRQLRDRFGNLGLAAAAYNAGPRRVERWLAGEGVLPDETIKYVQIVTGHDSETWRAGSISRTGVENAIGPIRSARAAEPKTRSTEHGLRRRSSAALLCEQMNSAGSACVVRNSC